MIRKATVADASRIAEILIFAKRVAYRHIFQNDAVSFGEMLVLPLALEYAENQEMCDEIMLFDDGIVKGIVSTHIPEDTKGVNSMEIKQLYVDPFFQKQGIGGELMDKALAYAKEFSVESIFLWVLEKNLNARCFYERKGFSFTGEQKFEEGTTELLLLYRKII